ncbi:ABC transporter substrate-binding protein [Conexibacter arvalis]|uniref:Peptide/nickel transport system substrate-binding protein n=1 Tax=Conexibacter arvalis TaxID=912552 RepID=A0A840IFD0_9ACTN|nr:ABC transporter substrate-binding protein [Conexibacter arvalis]MBB4663562.1 peptide/nickel transport system substrate-binding protein [Conexibacter arvalis]
MRFWARIACAMLVALALSVFVAACGGGDDEGGGTTSAETTGGAAGGARQGGTITVLMGTAPDYLDPQLAYTTQAVEAHWISYTGLLTYARADGEAGTRLLPGLAEDLPTISRDGRTYDFVLRRGLRYSDGTPVRATDFPYSVERMVRIPWGGRSFVTNYVVGAQEYDTGRARSISGITANDATGRITIRLREAYGAFENVLAFPALAFVPSGTPMRNLSSDPPPGVGPYMLDNVVPNRSFTVRRNPLFADFRIPDIPLGNLDAINVRLVSNTNSEAQQVLNNQADIFDPGDTLPPALLPQIESQARDRFERKPVPSTFYFFLNTTKPPFDNERARQAVNMALDRDALVRLSSGFFEPSCFFLPEGIVGHPDSPCPFGDEPDIEGARRIIREEGLEGTRLVVWGQERSPRKEYVDYYTDMLNRIGFDAQERIIADTVYFPTIGNERTDPQTGFANWLQDFPNPSDFYLLLDARSIQPTNNQNFSKVDDPFIQRQLLRLNTVPASRLDTVADDWRSLDEYTARRAYNAVFGSISVPKFFSERLNFEDAIFHPLYFNDWSSISLK